MNSFFLAGVRGGGEISTQSREGLELIVFFFFSFSSVSVFLSLSF